MRISDEQRHQYAEEGYMIVPGFLNPEDLEIVRFACDGSIAEKEAEMRSRGVNEDGINVLGRKYFIPNAHKSYRDLMRVIFSAKAADVCRATIGGNAYLHNEQFVVKLNDKETSFAWHQDSGYSVYRGGAARHKPYVTCWVALDDMSAANGTISILPFSRSPLRGLMEHTWEASVNAMVGYHGDDEGDLVEVPAGTLVAFSSFLLHKSGPNTTERPRRSYFIAYTPELFRYVDPVKGVYNSGEPLLQDGELITSL